MDNRQIGRFIAECRKEKGMTQRELGEQTERYQNGKRENLFQM